MTARNALLIDVPDIVSIESAAFGPDLRWTDEDLRSEVDQGRVIVCELDGVSRVVGYAAFKIRDGVGTLNSVAVHPHWQSRGIGGFLTTQAVARMQDAECIELDCNTDLVPFYRRFEFDVCGFYTTGVGLKQRARVTMRRMPCA
jgi:ribosomal protein S18 acetylase RimI-like enzyme